MFFFFFGLESIRQCSRYNHHLYTGRWVVCTVHIVEEWYSTVMFGYGAPSIVFYSYYSLIAA